VFLYLLALTTQFLTINNMDFEELHNINTYIQYNTPDTTPTDISSTATSDNGKIVYKESQIAPQQIVGTDVVLSTGDMQSPNYAPGQSGWAIKSTGDFEANNGNFRGILTGATGIFSGTLSAGKIDIPNATNTKSFHVDSSGNTWWGSNAIGTAPAFVLSSGLATFAGVTITGANVSADSKIAYDSYNFSAALVAPNALSAKNMGFPIAFGSGIDGDLTVSGTTQIDTTKQYNNLTINNGGTLTSNAEKTLFIAIKATLTINSGGRISMAGKGSAGGYVAGNHSTGYTGANGINGSGSGAGVDYLDFTTRQGASGGAGGGGDSGGAYNGQGGNGGAGYSLGGAGITTHAASNVGVAVPQIIQNRSVLNQNILLNMWGAGGGEGCVAGQTGAAATGAGGGGGGTIYIECYSLVINENTNAIDVSGANGTNGSVGTLTSASGGGGGGAGGSIFIRYHTISNVNGSNTNILVTSGTGGNGATNGSTITAAGGAGGNGYYILQQI
jgi:hypothetical protein